MDRPASAQRRKSQVYVQIPPSPLVPPKVISTANARVPQENTPLKAVAMNVDHDGSSPPHPSSKPRKRKSMDAPHAEQETNTDHVPSKAKKAKNDTIVERTYTTGGAAQTNQDVTRKDSGALPHAGRCHQCTRPVDPSVSVRCTALRPTGKQCVFKYCKACMRNRYQQDINTIKSRGVKIPTEERSKHATDIDYVFRCPRCEDICNCRSCRKGKGLPATGDLHLLARKAAQLSAAPKPSTQLDESGLPSQVNTSTAAMSVTTIPKPRAFKLKPHVLIPPSPHTTRRSDPSSAEKAKRRPNHPKREVAPKVVPEPVWTPLPTPLNYEGARERIHVREFLLRFSHLTEIARGHLEELEDVGSSTLGDRGVEEEEEEARSSKASVTTWISEASLKGIFVGLLTLLSKDPEQEQHVQALTKAIQSIKSAGVNLNRMSAALITLRENSSIALPGPLPFASTVRHSRRSGSLAQEASQHSVFSSAQLVPAVSALVDQALQTKAVREDFERAVSQEKDLARAMRELTVEENKRWKSTLDAKNTTPAHRKAARVAHKEALAAIEHAHKVAMSECVPRFAPLGRDTDGRVYFALTPGMIEREAAVDLLEGGTGEVRWGKRRGVADEAQRKRLRHWSWFLAVYGRKPEGAQVANSVGGDGNVGVGAEEEDGDAEGWWGFWQPEEVAKLSEWLAAKYGIDIEAKRLPKASNEGTAVDSSEPAMVPETKPRGRPSNASSAADTSYEASSSRFRSFASLNRDSSDYEAEYAPSSNSSHAEDELYMRVDAGGEPVPTRQDLVGLVRGLVDYADLLDWRIKHASKDTKGTPIEVNKAGKGKSVEVEQAIPTQSFYGGK